VLVFAATEALFSAPNAALRVRLKGKGARLYEVLEIAAKFPGTDEGYSVAFRKRAKTTF